MKKKKVLSIVLISVITVLIALLAFITFASFPVAGYKNGTYDFVSITKKIGENKLTAEFSEGVYYELTLVDKTAYDEEETSVDEMAKVIRNRLNALGYDSAIVTAYEDDSISILADAKSTIANDISVVTAYGEVTFQDKENKIILGQDQIKSAKFSRTEGYSVITINLTKQGEKLLAEATSADDSEVHIYIGETDIFGSNIKSCINEDDGSVITLANNDTSEETVARFKGYALEISTGGLAVEYKVSDAKTVTPVYGKINATVIALVVAVAVIMVAIAVMYRGFAIAGDLSVLASVLLTLFFIAVIPGISISTGGLLGLIAVAVLAVEGVVTVLHEVRKEYAKGKTLRASYKHAYGKATFLMLDITVLCGIVALLMLFICTGSLKSFAMTFGIGVIVTALVNQLLLRLLVKLELPLTDSEKFFNLKREEGEVNE